MEVLISTLIGWFLLLLLAAIILLRFSINKSVACKNNNRLDGKITVITGATSGIGKVVATECARRGATVVLACRNRAKAEAVTTKIRKSTSNEDVSFIQLELSSFDSIRNFFDSFCERHTTIDILINNAAYLGPKASTIDGHDYCFQTNFLGHFYLTNLLVPYFMNWRRKSSSPSSKLRIINLASHTYVSGKLNLDDLMMTKCKYNIFEAYATTKLAMILFTKELNKRFPAEQIVSIAVHPGAVRTGLQNNWPGLFGCLLRIAAVILFRNAKTGSESIVHCATADKIESLAGKLIYNCTEVAVKPIAQDFETAERLWAVAEEMCMRRKHE